MTEQNYKPGDVAVCTIDGTPVLHVGDLGPTATGRRRTWATVGGKVVAIASDDLRPLAVIDPEDGYAVLRLTEVFMSHLNRPGIQPAQALTDTLREYVKPVVSSAEALYVENTEEGRTPFGDLSEESRNAWATCARMLSERLGRELRPRPALEDPADVLPEGYERTERNTCMKITDADGDTMQVRLMSGGSAFFSAHDTGVAPSREQFSQLVADLTPWMNGADS